MTEIAPTVIKKYSSKLIQDAVHGFIRLTPMAIKIIDTPEFQRLRDIKQLGMCHYVFPTAIHSRFEHSIGVYHLAGALLNNLKQRYSSLEFDVPGLGKQRLSNLLIELIKVAGLCHDIGHGPGSHVFDDLIMKESTHPNKTHEVRSGLIIEKILTVVVQRFTQL